MNTIEKNKCNNCGMLTLQTAIYFTCLVWHRITQIFILKAVSHLCFAVTTGPYEPNWNKLPCCSVNNTWHVCPYLKPWLWLGKILRVDFKASDIQELVSQPFLSACVEMRGATGGAPGPLWWEICFLLLLQGLARKFGLGQLFQCCVGACNFGKKQTFLFSHKNWEEEQLTGYMELGYSASSRPTLLRAAGAGFVEKDALSAPLDASHLLTELPHMVASALTFIIVCDVLSTIGAPIFPHRCCSGNYWSLWCSAQSRKHLFES